MFSKCFHFVILTVIFLLLQGAACFFVKHVQTGMCISVTTKIHKDEYWGNLAFVELSNNCLDPAAQFRFLDNNAMFSFKRKGCFEANKRDGTGYNLPMLYSHLTKIPSENCRDKVHAMTQTSWGGLSANYYPDKGKRCAVPKTDVRLATNPGIDPYIGLTTNCNDAKDKRFNFGSVTCRGNMVKNANCPKYQYIVVKTASYRRLSDTKTCSLSDDYSCEVDVRCLVKELCDGQHECSITVDDNLFSGDPCPGLTKYLYFEYQCNDTSTPYVCVPEGPPLKVKVTAGSSSSLSVTWDPPEKDKRNGIIVSYNVCISHEESKPCFREYTTKEKMIVIKNLIDSTKYYVRVLASTKAGRGPYSESKGKFTNGKQQNGTAYTLTFSLPISSRNFTHFYVVALTLKDGQESQSPDSYENNDLVTYAEARKSTDPKPYIAAVVTSKDENMFKLGDGRNTSNPTSRRRRSTTSDYYNGPLEPGTSYSIFQRIFINDKGDYYSTDWSPASKTSEYSGAPRVLTKISSGDIKAKEDDLVNLLCSAQGEPPITFSWEKDQNPLNSLMEIEKPHRSSLLVVTVKDQTSFGKYICHIRDRFQSTTHTISIQKVTGENYLAGIIVLAILLAISFVIIAYLIYQNRRLKSSKANPDNKSKDRNNSEEIDENPENDDGNYEKVEKEESTYTALKRPGPGEEDNDGHLYTHLNEVHKDYVIPKETGF